MSETNTATQVVLKLGRRRRSFILTSGPKPKVGEICRLGGEDWTVSKVEQVRIFASFTTKCGTLQMSTPK